MIVCRCRLWLQAISMPCGSETLQINWWPMLITFNMTFGSKSSFWGLFIFKPTLSTLTLMRMRSIHHNPWTPWPMGPSARATSRQAKMVSDPSLLIDAPINPWEVYERKWEIDSLASFLSLSYRYWQTTGDGSFMTKSVWIDAVDTILNTLRKEQQPTFNLTSGKKEKRVWWDSHRIRWTTRDWLWVQADNRQTDWESVHRRTWSTSGLYWYGQEFI